MSRKIIILFIISSVLLFFSCDKKQTANKNSANAEIKKGIAPVADNEIAVIEMEQPAFGTIKIELYSNIAPKMVARFKELADEGVYNGTTFHRINQSVIQGGDPFSKDDNPNNDGTGNSDKPDLQAEFSDIPFDTGIVGAARLGQDTNSANSQFFIMLKRESAFDKNYTIFGKVIEGMGNVRTIAGVNPKQGERPLENVVIKSVTILPKK
ncbi:MAG: peptidylprolyl isomerase [Acidobacteria bacterium]|nr:peptidylprolyl isomerase [Acidobacteriota bacterium]MCA1639926.1 peptidylprolyl isomerase [Acidobacteriota bacterium]